MKTIISKKNGIAIIFAVLFLGACASTGTIQPTMKLQGRLSVYKTLLVQVSSDLPDSSRDRIELESLSVAKLHETGLFEKVFASTSSPDVAADLEMKIRIQEMKKVSSGSRVILGMLAGQARVVVSAELIDLREGKTISSFLAEGKSSGGTVFAGTTPQALERCAEQLVLYIEQNM